MEVNVTEQMTHMLEKHRITVSRHVMVMDRGSVVYIYELNQPATASLISTCVSLKLSEF